MIWLYNLNKKHESNILYSTYKRFIIITINLELTWRSLVMGLESLLQRMEIYPILDKVPITSDEYRAEGYCTWTMFIQKANGYIEGILCSSNGNRHSISVQNTGQSPKHTHDYIEIGYIVYGEIILSFTNKMVTFCTGDFFFIGRGVEHCESLPSIDSCYFYLLIPTELFDSTFVSNFSSQIMINFIQSTLAKKGNENGYLLFRPQGKNRVDLILKYIAEEIDARNEGYQYFIKGWIVRLIEDLCKHYKPVLHHLAQHQLREIIYLKVDEYMRNNCASVTVKELCVKFHYNSCYFNQLIHDFSNESYMSHLQTIRLSQAANMLKTTDYSIKTIAEKVGYRNLTFFNKIFRMRYNTNPGDYRKFHK